MSSLVPRKAEMVSESFIKRLGAELTEIIWLIIVSHWKVHVKLAIVELQQCYNGEQHFLEASLLNRIKGKPIKDAIELARVDINELLQQIQSLMYENICFLHSDETITSTDAMLRRGMLRFMLKDKIKTFLLPPYRDQTINRIKNISKEEPKRSGEKEGKAKENEKEKIDRPKNTKKDILKSIEAEVALEEDQKKRFNSDDYADLRDILNIE